MEEADFEIVGYLLEDNKIDATLKDTNGYTAMTAAANNSNDDIVDLLKCHLYPFQLVKFVR